MTSALRPPTPQPLQLPPPTPHQQQVVHQQFPTAVMGAGSNQVLQIIQGHQLISTQNRQQIITSTGHHQLQQHQQQHHQHHHHQYVHHNHQQQTQHQQSSSGNKQNKAPQQILPKPAASATTTASAAVHHQSVIQQTATASSTTSMSTSNKTLVTQTKAISSIQTQQQQHHQQQQQQAQQTAQTNAQLQNQQVAAVVAAAQQSAAQQGQPIILPAGNLNQPLLLNQLNQMPVIVQQNTPQGVQLILRPPTPQLAAPSLVIHNARPQMQQTHQPQQLLRILNTNGAMQLATPTFIVSSQANLMQQNIHQNIKSTTGSPMALGGLHQAAQRQPQQLAAALNSHILGQSMAQLQNLQLANGNLAQIQMPGGLNGQFISGLPPQFQQTITGFTNQINQNINLNQISSSNLTQIATAFQQSQQQQHPQTSQVSNRV